MLSSPEKTKKAVDILNERVNFIDITIEDYDTVNFLLPSQALKRIHEDGDFSLSNTEFLYDEFPKMFPSPKSSINESFEKLEKKKEFVNNRAQGEQQWSLNKAAQQMNFTLNLCKL